MNLQIVQQPNTEVHRSIPLTKGMSLYHTLHKEGISLSAPCAGNGTCGACKVRVLQGNLPVTEKDKKFLSEEQLGEGWRLACQAYPGDGDCGNSNTTDVLGEDGNNGSTDTENGGALVIYIPIETFAAVTGYENDNRKQHDKPEVAYAIAIDLGTTTIAYELFSMETGRTCQILSSTNPQRSYGADVVSRMEQSNNGRKDMLKNILRQRMRSDISNLIKNVNPEKIKQIGISGNTAMVHFFMGYSCEELGRYPFTAVTLECIDTDAANLGIMDREIPVSISPGISAYVGGDILMGAASLNIQADSKPCLFLDLGTNAEMLLADGNGKVYVTSAPAGPAFEAANISCGVGSVAGAISGMSIQNKKTSITTIGDCAPVGFCGSGILEAIYELLKNNLIDETGLLADEYFATGFPIDRLRITQNDIRQIQLAKSAVISAIRILLKAADISADEVDKVYLAGGFGFHLNVEKAIGIGLLPKEFAGKVTTVGNTSLKGTKEYLLGSVPVEVLNEMKQVCEEIYLSNDPEFQRLFMENMNFE